MTPVNSVQGGKLQRPDQSRSAQVPSQRRQGAAGRASVRDAGLQAQPEESRGVEGGLAEVVPEGGTVGSRGAPVRIREPCHLGMGDPKDTG